MIRSASTDATKASRRRVRYAVALPDGDAEVTEPRPRCLPADVTGGDQLVERRFAAG
jgi:hypothetical protein